MARLTHRGNPIRTNGELPPVGGRAPDFRLTTTDLKDVSLADYRGKKKVLNIVPSLDTPTCATSTRKFNEVAGSLPNTVVLVVSADLPYAAKRFCETEGLKNVVPLSLMRDRSFADDYGVHILDGLMAGITARAIVVIDENDVVTYTELVPEIRQEPDYEKALAAVR